MTTYRVRLLSGRSGDFTEVEQAHLSAQNQAHHGNQAAVLAVAEDGDETLLKTYLKRIPLPEPEPGAAGGRGRGPLDFVFIVPGGQ